MAEKTIVLKVNDNEVSLNPFVKRVLTNVIDGLVDSLDKIPANKDKIEILIERGG